MLRSEHLALNTIVKNPEILRYQPKQYQDVIPVLNQQLGGLYDAAYALAVCPELLAVVRPQQYRETFQALEDCLGTRDDAVWTMMQTLVPTTLEVTARPWYCEELVGTYTRVEGLRINGRPVWEKPKEALKHRGDKAKIVRIIYNAVEGSGIDGTWEFAEPPPE